MKNKILTILLVFISYILSAQSPTKEFPLSVSYFGYGFFNPGLKLGTEFSFKEWNIENNNRRSIYISPQIGFSTLKRVHNSFLMNTDFGYKIWHLDNSIYSNVAIGLGYLYQTRVIEVSSSIGSGEITNIKREINHHFLPTINYEFGKQWKDNLITFVKITAGQKLFGNQESDLVTIAELGFQLKLKTK